MANSSTANTNPPGARKTWAIVGGVFVAVALCLILLVVFFPWDTLRGPINRYVSEKTGRKFEITRHLDVKLGFCTVRVDLDGIEFANPDWARKPYLVKADRAEVEVRIWPLLAQRVVIPRLALYSPALGLQMEKDGRKTWALGKDTSDSGTTPTIGLLQVDSGTVDFLAKHLGVDLQADLNFDSSLGELPLSYRIKGRYQSQPLSAEGRTGSVLQLNAAGQPPFPLEIDATAGATRLKASGTVAELATLDGVDAKFDLKGQSLGDLYGLLGVALPETSPYAVSGAVRMRSKKWDVTDLKGKLGLSDIEGTMQFDQAPKVPHLGGQLHSKVMDMDDLGPLIGLPPTKRSANAIEGVAPPPTIAEVKKKQRDPGAKVLPTATLDLERLRAMNADVKYAADRIRNVHELPLDKGSVQVKLADSVLTLDPLDLGIANGQVGGSIRIDASAQPSDIRAAIRIKGMQLNRLIPKVETLKTSLGKLDGQVNLSGKGNSVASWLGNSSGDVSMLTGRGKFSNLLLEVMGLDGGEIIKFIMEGDHDVTLRCAALAFDVNRGVATGRTLVFDTSDTVFNATGNVDLSRESMDFVIKQQPKDMSILAFRTPLVIGGTFASPKAGVEVAPLAARGAAAVALAALNPLLALAATIETGPGEDVDCKEVLAQAKQPTSAAAAAGAGKAKKQ